jgi:hypothetical protein
LLRCPTNSVICRVVLHDRVKDEGLPRVLDQVLELLVSDVFADDGTTLKLLFELLYLVNSVNLLNFLENLKPLQTN